LNQTVELWSLRLERSPGIGPTHGDITADCVAKAFGVPIDSDPSAFAILHEWMKTTGAQMNEARLYRYTSNRVVDQPDEYPPITASFPTS
jgi:hypothetical protein